MNPASAYMSGFRLDGHTALVTGASSGIGRAIALALAEAGAGLLLHALRDDPQIAEAARLAHEHGAPCVASVSGDFSSAVGVERVVAEAQSFGVPDIVVSNVGRRQRQPYLELTTTEVDRQWRINVGAALQLVQAFAPAMVNRRWGRILLVGSVQGAKPHPEFAAYSATKAALANLAQNFGRQFAPHGVTVNCLAPGAIRTEFNRDLLSNKETAAAVCARIPAGCIGEPADCAAAALLLCSDAGRYITGQTLYVDGGMSLT